MVEEQRGLLKSNVAAEVAEVVRRLEAFASRWASLKPKEMKTWGKGDVEAVFAALVDWTAQLESIKAAAASLRESCEGFQLAPPSFGNLAAVEADVEAVNAAWAVFQAYHVERTALATQDWFTFRGHMFDLQDFSNKWLEAVRGRPKDAVYTRIGEEADAIRRAFSALKFARGEPFKDEHWSAMFKKLGLPKAVRPDNLLVGHFLDALEAVAANLGYLKDLTSRAQGEVTIREALHELQGWSETSEFKLLEHVSNVNGRKTSE